MMGSELLGLHSGIWTESIWGFVLIGQLCICRKSQATASPLEAASREGAS